ncbi:actin monomer binding protein-like protein [Lojkania enalia]|uniref:Actin monomer binding protein-like protein n=1 Tax=Lojkania enalia TaxID=147567 RepID=A0A9P4NBB9_9PLEO|nr:actin monomer binding protein-like protein [Didymosphaeria enalia]
MELTLSSTISRAFDIFVADETLFALPLYFDAATELQSAAPIPYHDIANPDFKTALTQLDGIINYKTPLYLLIRRQKILIAITYVPYIAPAILKELYLSQRQAFVRQLGESRIALSVICKEPAEVYDYRSWEERDSKEEFCSSCATDSSTLSATKDLGYQKNKCRLCDQRMKNKIEENAGNALKNLNNAGNCVQLSLDVPTETLKLNFSEGDISPSDLAARLPKEHPSYTFYRHPDSNILYFIYCSPDSAPVKVRMASIMAIAGLISITAKNMGANIDQKIEIHDGEDLEFEEGDEKIGRFRSLYLLNPREGTESIWSNTDQH